MESTEQQSRPPSRHNRLGGRSAGADSRIRARLVEERVKLWQLATAGDEMTIDQMRALAEIATLGLTPAELTAFERRCQRLA